MSAHAIEAQAYYQQRPNGQSPVMHQQWQHLLFMHWEVPADLIQAQLPSGLEVDTYQGRAYIAIVPFYMRYIRPAYLPSVPWLSFFLETNVRTYVKDANGRPGVWFFSLDANQPIAVMLARSWFHLPYQHARMQAKFTPDSSSIQYYTRRRGDRIESLYQYQPDGDLFTAMPGTLEFFLAERYLLFAWNRRKKHLIVGQVHHRPYPLYHANVRNWDARLLELNGLPNPKREPDHLLYSPGVEVEVFKPTMF